MDDHTGGMDWERRLERLEARFDSFEKRVGRVKSMLDGLVKDVAEIKGRIATMPTARQLLGMNLTMILAMMGATFAIARFGFTHP
jgi:hypothetical protein